MERLKGFERAAFQSTLPRGSDASAGPRKKQLYNISIHAPSRERPYCITIEDKKQNFNPRSLAGATLQGSVAWWLYKFQSTLPRGSDILQRSIRLAPRNFNPRSLAGATLIASGWGEHFIISIHAPSRERRHNIYPCAARAYFNPRSLAGATCWRRGSGADEKHFNPRSLAGATQMFELVIWLKQHFNPRSLAGATLV